MSISDSSCLHSLSLGEKELRLSHWRLAYADELYQLISKDREYLRPWLGWISEIADPFESECYIRQLQHAFIEHRAFPCALHYGGQLAGFCGLDRINRFQRRGRMGYWLGHEHQGKGLMTAAGLMLLELGFGELALAEIECLVDESNLRSRAVCERLGLVLQESRVDDELLCYRITKDNYVG
jgi:Acetyltransferases, including N-acetylases of ribosomal proteins